MKFELRILIAFYWLPNSYRDVELLEFAGVQHMFIGKPVHNEYSNLIQRYKVLSSDVNLLKVSL